MSKCDELTCPIKIDIPGIGTIESKDLLLKTEVDAVIAELKEENSEIQKQTDIAWGKVNAMYDEITELKDKNEKLKESNDFLRNGFSCGERFEKLKARTTALIHDKAITPEVRRIFEDWRDCAYHNYYLYVEECKAYQEVDLQLHEMSVANKRHTTKFEKFGIRFMAIIEKFSTMFRRNK